MEEMLHPGDVARIFGVHERTVRRWADSGKLKSVRTIGNHRRFRRQDIEEWINAPSAKEARSNSKRDA